MNYYSIGCHERKFSDKEVVGLTHAPDGRWYANLSGFRQFEITAKAYEKLKTTIQLRKTKG